MDATAELTDGDGKDAADADRDDAGPPTEHATDLDHGAATDGGTTTAREPAVSVDLIQILPVDRGDISAAPAGGPTAAKRYGNVPTDGPASERQEAGYDHATQSSSVVALGIDLDLAALPRVAVDIDVSATGATLPDDSIAIGTTPRRRMHDGHIGRHGEALATTTGREGELTWGQQPAGAHAARDRASTDPPLPHDFLHTDSVSPITLELAPAADAAADAATGATVGASTGVLGAPVAGKGQLESARLVRENEKTPLLIEPPKALSPELLPEPQRELPSEATPKLFELATTEAPAEWSPQPSRLGWDMQIDAVLLPEV